MNKKTKVPVIIRMRAGFMKKDRIPVAFFPTLPGTCFHDLLCYERVGQHSAACESYMNSCTTPTVADRPSVEALLKEIKSIYETGPDAVTLVQRRRNHRQYFEIRKVNYNS